MAADPNCVFCKIASGEIPSTKIAETELAFAFMDIAPIATGHALVIPREHYENIGQMPPAVAAAVHELAACIAPVLQQTVGAEGLNVLQNNGRVAGQVVMHVHVHLIPRKSGDGLRWPWPAQKADPQQLQRIAQDVTSHLAKI